MKIMLIQKKANKILSVTVVPIRHVKEEKQIESFCIYSKPIRKECLNAKMQMKTNTVKYINRLCLQDNNTSSIRNKSGL